MNVNMQLSVLNVHESPEFMCNKEIGVQVYDGDIWFQTYSWYGPGFAHWKMCNITLIYCRIPRIPVSYICDMNKNALYTSTDTKWHYQW